MNLRKILLGFGALMTLPAIARQSGSAVDSTAHSNRLEEVTVQGNRLQVPFLQSSRDIQIISGKFIEQLPARSVNEVLSYISGVDVRQRGPFGTQTDISIDGGTSEQVLLLINGVKMIDSQTAHNMMNIPVPLTAIDHIEVLRGAAARIYGINALTGAINIVTKKERRSFVVADIRGGSSFKDKEAGDGRGIYAGGNAELTANYGTERQSHLLSLGQTLYNGQRYNTASGNTRLFYNGNYEFDSNNSIQGIAGYAYSRFGANGFYAAPGDINSQEVVKSSVFSLSSKHQWGKFTLSPRISDRYGEDDYRYFKDDLSKGRSKHYTNALMLELNSSLSTAIGMLGFGWESRLEKISSSNIGKHDRKNHGAYAELATSLSRHFKGTLGLYANYNTDYGWQVYPGMDLAYLIDEHWRISTSIGSGQRIPSFTDLYLNQLPGNIGNASLKPENAWSYEGNVQYRKQTFTVQGGYFYRNITDFIDWIRSDASNPYSPVNFGSNKMQGLYVRLFQTLNLGSNNSFGYKLSYNHLNPRINTSDNSQSKYVLESLRHQVIAGVNYNCRKMSAQIENRLLKRELGKAYAVTDIRVNYTLSRLILYTEVTNLFDSQYTEAGAVPMPTRWYGLGLKYTWTAK